VCRVLVEVLLKADDEIAHSLFDGDDGVPDLLWEVEPVPLAFSDRLLQVALELRLQAGCGLGFARQGETVSKSKINRREERNLNGIKRLIFNLVQIGTL